MPLDPDALLAAAQQATAEVAPAVESAAGRPFFEPPAVGVITADDLFARTFTRLSIQPDTRGLSEKERTVRAKAMVEGMDALYDTEDRTIWFVEEPMQRIFDDWSVPASAMGPLLRCIAAHESTHALQDQYAGIARFAGTELDDRAEVLFEGHANRVERAVCPDGFARAILDAEQGVDVLSSQPQDPASVPFRYGYGERFVAAVEAKYGNDGLWALLAGTPPSTEDVIRVGQQGLSPGWHDLEYTGAAARLLVGNVGAWDVEHRAASPLEMLPGLAPGTLTEAHTPRPVAGQAWGGTSAHISVTVMAFAFEDDTWARFWLDRRATDLASMRATGGVRLLGDAFQLMKFKSLKTDALGADAAMHFRHVGQPYQELWALRGTLLVGVVANGLPLTDDQVRSAALALLDRRPDDAVAPADAVDLSAYAPVAPAGTSLHWSWFLHDAVAAQAKGDYATCLQWANQAVGAASEADLVEVIPLAHGCSTMVEDLPQSDALAARVPMEKLLPDSRTRHGVLLLKARRWREAVAMVDGLTFDEPQNQRIVADIRLEGLLGAKDWRSATALASTRIPSPATRMDAAGRLLNAGRYADVYAVLKVTCNELQAGDRAKCERLRDTVSP